MFTSQERTGICFHYESDEIVFPTDVENCFLKPIFCSFICVSRIKGATSVSWETHQLLYLSEIRDIDRDSGREAANCKNNCVSSCPGLKFPPCTPQLCHTSDAPGDTVKGQLFYFPEFLHSPIRCALTAHDDDLGVFIPARLNIYFSAQGEAGKKNVSLWGSTSGGFNTIPHPPHSWRLQDTQLVMAPKESWDTY